MADRWRFIRTVLYQIGYDTYDSLEGIELVSISEDDYLYFTDGGVLYKADLDSTEKEPVNPPTTNTIYTLTAVELLDGGSGYNRGILRVNINGSYLNSTTIQYSSDNGEIIDTVSIVKSEGGRYPVLPDNPYVLDASGATVQLTWSNELAVYTKQLSDAEIGDDYYQVIEGVGGELPYTFSIDGTLPSGITLSTVDDNSASLSSEEVTANEGTYTFNVVITDKNKDTTFKTLSIDVKEVGKSW
jgi:hypothetical protein